MFSTLSFTNSFRSIFLISCIVSLHACNQSYKPNDPTTALPPSGWENAVIVTQSQCNLQNDFFTFTIASQFPLTIGLTNNQIQLNFRCYNSEYCQLSDSLSPTCTGTAWPTAPSGTVSCQITSNLVPPGCSTNGCAVNSGNTTLACYQAGLTNACAQGLAGSRVCQITNLPIGISGFPQSISYDFKFIGPTF